MKPTRLKAIVALFSTYVCALWALAILVWAPPIRPRFSTYSRIVFVVGAIAFSVAAGVFWQRRGASKMGKDEGKN